MKISIDHAKEGMVLLAPVVDVKGRLILPKGEVLNPHVMGRLARFGVSHVDVETLAADAPDDGNGAAPAAPAVDEGKIREEIERRFADIGTDERMTQIRDAIVGQLVQRGVAKPI